MQVDFYKAKRRFVSDPPSLLCALASQCVDGGQTIAWLVDDMAAATGLDERLWQIPPDSFLPHHIAGTDGDGDEDLRCPLLIVVNAPPPAARPVVINQRQQAVKARVERVIELILPDATNTAAARARWAQYKKQGIEPRLVEV